MQTLDSQLKSYISSRGCTTKPVMLRTFLHTDTPSYPVGVFNVSGTFLGIANNENEYVVIWNSDISNQAEGTLQTTPEPLKFNIDTNSTITQVTGLRYWQITLDSASSYLYLSDDCYVELPNATIVKSESYSLGTAVNEFCYSTLLTMPSSPITIVSDTFRKVPVTQGNIRVFHNEVGSYAGMNVFGLWKNNYGYLPPTLKQISFYRITEDLDINNISPLNYLNYYDATKNVELFQMNGKRVTWTSNYVAHMSKLKSFQFVNNLDDASNRYFSNFGLNAVKHPELQQILIRYNSLPSLGVVSISDFSSLPSLTWGIDLQGARVNTSSDLDNVLIGLDSSMTTAPVSGTKINVSIQQAVSRTSASDAAVASLTLKGYTVS